jgi:hypothetical protein
LVRRLPFLLILLGSMIGPQTSLASPRELPDSSPRVTPVSDGLIVEWTAHNPTISEGAEGRTLVEIPGFINTNQPGAPRVPYSSVLVALPPGANPSVEVLAASESTNLLHAPVTLGKQPGGVQLDSNGQIIGGSFVNPAKEDGGPDAPVQLEQIGIVRGANLARLSFFPVRVSGQNLQVTTRLKVKVNFGAQLLQSPRIVTDPLLEALESAVINPGHLESASPDLLHAPAGRTAQQLASNPTAAIEVSEKGITELSYSDLAGVGFPVNSTNPNQLHLTRSGMPVDYEWLGDGDAAFEPHESLLFFADPRFSRWTSADTYFLSSENTSGARMQTRAADAGTTAGIPWVEKLFEENNIYTPQCYCAPIPAGRDGDRWVWDRLQKPAPSTGNYQFQLNGVDTTQTAEMSIWFIGFTSLGANPDHKVEVNLNGHDLGSKQWDGKNAFQADFSFSGSFLNEGGNTLTITLPDVPGIPVNGIWLDAFSVRHALSGGITLGESIGFTGPNHNHDYSVSMASATGIRIYDVSKTEQPVELTGFQVAGNQITFSNPNTNQPHDYWVTTTAGISAPSNLRMVSKSQLFSGFTGADYLIITPEKFISSLAPLIGLHQSNGLEVAVEDVQAIYDAYGDGRPLPTAIHTFLEEAYYTWDKAPIYVLLVGDGTHDPRGYISPSSATLIPPFLAVVDPWAGETATDNRYVTVDGEDTLPDMLIGRLPANSIAELDTMVSKIVQYEDVPPLSTWQRKAVFVADDNDPRSGDFPSISDILISKFPSQPFAPQRLYYDPNQTTEEEFRSEVQQAWDAGSGLIMYTGHSSVYFWAHEYFLHLNNVPGLENGQKLPVVLEMTCFTGSFQFPYNPDDPRYNAPATLDEALLRHPAGGAVAVWGSTGLGVSTGHHWLAEGFMNTIYRDGISEIGKAALAGKLNLVSVGTSPDLIDTFNLLGDPATKLERSIQNYIPITQN